MRTVRFSGSGVGGSSPQADTCRQTPCGGRPPSRCEQTDMCKNITLPQTSFAGGNGKCTITNLRRYNPIIRSLLCR